MKSVQCLLCTGNCDGNTLFTLVCTLSQETTEKSHGDLNGNVNVCLKVQVLLLPESQ